MNTPRPFFVVLIATCNRPALLAKRALPSVSAQSRLPDMVVIADDSASQFHARNRKTTAEFSTATGVQAVHVVNHRSKGASGTWNSGALAAMNALSKRGFRGVYLAVLDDDDAWLPGHLAQAESVAGGRNADLMAAAFERREPERCFIVAPPEKFNGRDFLIGNPGVVGSSLIVGMSAFLRAGMFDESLLACTDRDLCFRLSLLPSMTYLPLPETAVLHYADENRPRISNEKGAVKHAGLHCFADKYHGWMSNPEYAAFCRRAKTLFGWTEKKLPSAACRPPACEELRVLSKSDTGSRNEKIALVVGIIVHPQEKNNPLFSDLLTLAKDRRLSSVDVVVMPSSGTDIHAFRREMEKWRRAGLRMYCITKIAREWREFFGIHRSRSMRPIAVNRTILQHAVSRIAAPYRNPACWILDGDNRLHGLKIAGHRIKSYFPDYVGEIIRLRDAGYDAAIGEINGAAPLPRAVTVRTQTVDLMHMLGRLQASPDDRRRPNNIATMGGGSIDENFHHDCLAHPHLEQPVGIPPLPEKCSANDLIRELPGWLDRILAGDAVTRPLLNGGGTREIHRGGNTLVFEPEMLCEFPNGIVRGSLRGMRRQDEIWRLAGEKIFNRKIAAGIFPVTQSRQNDLPQAPDIERLANDAAGHAVVAAMREVAGQFDDVRQFVDSLSREDAVFYDKMASAANARIRMIQASFARICGALSCMRAMLNSGGGKHERAAVAALRAMERKFSNAAFLRMEKKCAQLLNCAAVREAFLALPETCRDFQSMQKLWSSWVSNEQKENAAAMLRHAGGVKFPHFLGAGYEGAVFTDGRRMLKVLHRWYSRTDIDAPHFLPSLAGKWQEGSAALPVLTAKNINGDLLLELPYKKTRPYRGGCGAGLVALLADFKRHGIVAWDISPDNLRREGRNVRLIDYGRDIRPFTARDFDLSVRKAWLCWRWGWRKDLRGLLTASLHDRDMPELCGYEIMKRAVEQYAARYRVADAALKDAVKGHPRRILDYGCGKGKNALAIAKSGISVAGYDPALTKKSAACLRTAGVAVIKNIAEEKNSYEVVLLSHVICEIPSDTGLRDCLGNIRRLLTPGGKVVVTACDMKQSVGDSTCAHNIMPRTANAGFKFLYRKLIHASGGERAHVHRPESMLLREFSRAGFRVVARRNFADIDINRMEICGGTLQWTLKPLPPRPATSLIIRACTMDAEDMEFQVRHLVEQLNFPRGFAEVILAVDVKTGNFLREHKKGNLSLPAKTAHRMQRQGWVDRVVFAPRSTGTIRKLNRQWLGLECAYSHAVNNAPLSVSFAAFAACKSRYAMHLDIDMFVGRTDSSHDYLGVMLHAMQKRNALAMSLNAAGATKEIQERQDSPFRVEVRGGLIDMARLKKMLPLPGRTMNSMPAAGWHRAADRLVAREHAVSLRGGDQRLFFVHPPNQYKCRGDAMDIVANAASCGIFPVRQGGAVEWDGDEAGWIPPLRNEKFIFVVCGRDVGYGKIERCFNSMERQARGNWGAVIMDDASMPECAAHLRRRAAENPRITYFFRRRQAGGLGNLAFAVRQLCGNPESVIITLDMDDALLGSGVLHELDRAYRQGADVTVGSMLRTDKQTDYPVCFDNPRANRGGNVWQHLRSFKRKLFCAVPDAMLRDTNGAYFWPAEDWAYMLPIIEAAENPVWIQKPLYLYEPDTARKKCQREKCEAAIARIIRQGVKND